MKANNIEDNFLGYFQQQVLTSYLDEPDKYEVKTDLLSGSINATSLYQEKQSKRKSSDHLISVRFGYRSMLNGEIAIAAFLPDLVQASSFNRKRWEGFLIPDPKWRKVDKRFDTWKKIYLEAKWISPKKFITWRIKETCRLINGLTSEAFDINFYKYGVIENIKFPSSQNSHSYENAITELNRYFVDGIDSKIIKVLLDKFPPKIKINESKDKSITILFKIFPELESSINFKESYKSIRIKRASAVHGIRKQANQFKAFEQFTKDLKILYRGLNFFLKVLEKYLNLNSKNAASRNESKKSLPNIVKPPHPRASIYNAKFMIGKRISKVEYGCRESIEGVHESEALIITFTDGSILGIDTGSNVWNVIHDLRNSRKLDANGFRSDFMLHWVPRIKK